MSFKFKKVKASESTKEVKKSLTRKLEPNSSTLKIIMKIGLKVGKAHYMMCPAMEKCCPVFVKQFLSEISFLFFVSSFSLIISSK